MTLANYDAHPDVVPCGRCDGIGSVESARSRGVASPEQEAFRRHADALSVAGDRFRGAGRLVYEGGVFRVEYEVRLEDHLPAEVYEWVAEHPGWREAAIRRGRVEIQYAEPA